MRNLMLTALALGGILIPKRIGADRATSSRDAGHQAGRQRHRRGEPGSRCRDHFGRRRDPGAGHGCDRAERGGWSRCARR